ncbi:MAG: hypothetical protein IPO37_12735 [Saprospiraceae bacterium]|nr:hypothetical protein [Saprospiraceae bacterium]
MSAINEKNIGIKIKIYFLKSNKTSKTCSDEFITIKKSSYPICPPFTDLKTNSIKNVREDTNMKTPANQIFLYKISMPKRCSIIYKWRDMSGFYPSTIVLYKNYNFAD